MPSVIEGYYKVVVFLPPEYREEMMRAINASMEPIYPNYDMVFSYHMVKGCWRPLEGSKPYQGSEGEVEEADELRLEFAIKAADLRRVVDAVIAAHPYEEPGIDIFPFTPGREVAGL